ncbi:MAG: dienelactone hydrolase family protein [Alphaproteobacteria bacterium]|nr:dienelactone hydrolase family protein [Alphaproteobacteria bacterium]
MTQPIKVEQKYIDLFMEYTHVPLPRRVFLDRLTLLAGGTIAASAVLPLLENNYAEAAIVEPNDPRITAVKEDIDGGDGVKVKTLVAKSRTATGRLPTLIVIHENRGLNPHIEDVTRRMAVEGFLALGVDLLSMAGGYPGTDEAAAQIFGQVQAPKAVAEVQNIAKLAAARPDSNGKVGIIGFCWGGGRVNDIMTSPATGTTVSAGVVYYGAPAGMPANAPNVKSPIMIHLGGLDTGTNAPYPAYIDALKAAGAKVQNFTYEGANHAFNNDTNAARYNEAAAKQAWDRSVAFLKDSLKA